MPNAFDIGARLLYRDALLLVIDKPAGLPVHPGPRGGETLTDHLDTLRFGLPRRPQPPHRVHCAASGWPIRGDAIYGPAPRGSALHLHARTLSIPLYPKRDAITVTAAAPPHIAEVLDRMPI